jgi:hypothetical protein
VLLLLLLLLLAGDPLVDGQCCRAAVGLLARLRFRSERVSNPVNRNTGAHANLSGGKREANMAAALEKVLLPTHVISASQPS